MPESPPGGCAHVPPRPRQPLPIMDAHRAAEMTSHAPCELRPCQVSVPVTGTRQVPSAGQSGLRDRLGGARGRRCIGTRPPSAHAHTCSHRNVDTHTHTVTHTLTNTHAVGSGAEESSCFFLNTCSHTKENRKGLGARDRKRKWPAHREPAPAGWDSGADRQMAAGWGGGVCPQGVYAPVLVLSEGPTGITSHVSS